MRSAAPVSAPRGFSPRTARRRASASLLALSLLAAPAAAGAQEPSLFDVLARATRYVSDLSAQLSGTVAEERYEQRATMPSDSSLGSRVGSRSSFYRRTLRSDYLLVRPRNAGWYYGFRDVFEVDGDPVRDRQDRLTELFLDPSATADRQIRGIVRDSSRYNIGDVQRNFNVPTLALLFLHPDNRSRFDFERTDDDEPPLGLDRPEGDGGDGEVWVVAYREDWPTTLIRGRERSNLPASGRFWIEPATGRVLATEVDVRDPEVEATIAVRYQLDDGLGHLVPAEMRERFENRRQRSRVDGTATYTGFRRFQVQVSESAPFRD